MQRVCGEWGRADEERAVNPHCSVGHVDGIGGLPECHPSRFK